MHPTNSFQTNIEFNDLTKKKIIKNLVLLTLTVFCHKRGISEWFGWQWEKWRWIMRCGGSKSDSKMAKKDRQWCDIVAKTPVRKRGGAEYKICWIMIVLCTCHTPYFSCQMVIPSKLTRFYCRDSTGFHMIKLKIIDSRSTFYLTKPDQQKNY